MSGIQYAGTSMCDRCCRVVKHKPFGGPHRWHGCRLRWIARRVARAERQGWREGYRFALDNVSDPMVYADISEYGSGWAGLIERGGIVVPAEQEGRLMYRCDSIDGPTALARDRSRRDRREAPAHRSHPGAAVGVSAGGSGGWGRGLGCWGGVVVKPLILVRCRAHSASVCWIIRRWQPQTNSYVFESSYSAKEGA